MTPRCILSLLCALSGGLVGCTTTVLTATLPDDFDFQSSVDPSIFEPAQEALRLDFDSIYPTDSEEGLTSNSPAFTRELLLRTRPGAQVHLVDTMNRRYEGTLLRLDQKKVELMNCFWKETVPGPDGQQQCQTCHVPFQTLELSTLTHCNILARPSSDFAISDDPCDLAVVAMVFKSGRQQQWGKPRGTDQPHQTSGSTKDE